jgi:hypothetical protein
VTAAESWLFADGIVFVGWYFAEVFTSKIYRGFDVYSFETQLPIKYILINRVAQKRDL